MQCINSPEPRNSQSSLAYIVKVPLFIKSTVNNSQTNSQKFETFGHIHDTKSFTCFHHKRQRTFTAVKPELCVAANSR